jgi:3-methylcrotonyl-CoA carboxylase alpha subunit
MADEAYCVGPAPALESYLNVEAIVAAARESGAQAVHPGYGFLAENAAFARAVLETGLSWIGPPPEAIALMGDKVAAKDLAQAAGVPVAPGYSGDDQSDQHIQAEADRIGYPVMLKAAAGGGGKGMRVVDRREALVEAAGAARREARSAFGDDRIFLEKFLPRARHIEIQVLLDASGNGVFLGERDCSVQRRHQKVVEECPSPVITEDLRVAMGEAALRLARAAGYSSAGTVEYLFSGDSFYFLEMNTRIQVEHPVTEMVTGLDLVRAQIDISSGKPLGLSQLDVELRGHAIEARVYAEDPDQDFLPATGTVRHFHTPSGPGVRNDVGVFSGAAVTQWYDPLLAKLIVHAATREQAVERLNRALGDYAVLGVRNNLGFLRWLVDDAEFRSGNVDTSLIARRWRPEVSALPPEALLAAAAFDLTEVPSSSAGNGRFDPWKAGGGWRIGGASRTFTYFWEDQEYRVTAAREPDDRWRLEVCGEARTVTARRPTEGLVVVMEGSSVLRFPVLSSSGRLEVEWHGRVYALERQRLVAAGHASARRGEASLTAPMTGTVVRVAVEKGQRV